MWYSNQVYNFQTIWCFFAYANLALPNTWMWVVTYVRTRKKERERILSTLFSPSKRNFNGQKRQNKRIFKEKANSCVNTDLCVLDTDVRQSDIQLKSLEHSLNVFLFCVLCNCGYIYYYDFTEHIFLVYFYVWI